MARAPGDDPAAGVAWGVSEDDGWVDPGLCGRCRHARPLRGARSIFWLCELARYDPRFPRYPRLPMLRCDGFQAGRPGWDRDNPESPRDTASP